MNEDSGAIPVGTTFRRDGAKYTVEKHDPGLGLTRVSRSPELPDGWGWAPASWVAQWANQLEGSDETE